MSKHRKDITLLVHCEKTYSGSKRGSMGCDGKSGRWGQIGSRGVQRGVCGWGWGWRKMEGTESHE